MCLFWEATKGLVGRGLALQVAWKSLAISHAGARCTLRSKSLQGDEVACRAQGFPVLSLHKPKNGSKGRILTSMHVHFIQ